MEVEVSREEKKRIRLFGARGPADLAQIASESAVQNL